VDSETAAAVLAELRAMREVLAEILTVQAALLAVVADEGPEETDLEGNPVGHERSEDEPL